MKLKSLLITVFAALFVAHSGAFFTVWELPYQKDHYTIHDTKKSVEKFFGWTNSLRDKRNGYRESNESLFAGRNQALDRIEKR